MKKFQFLLLDTGPIIKLFELNLWERFIEMCDVTISRIIVDQAKYASQEFEDVRVDLEPYEQKGFIKIVDVDICLVKAFYDQLNTRYKESIHDGEKETLSFLFNASEDWQVCSADRAVFKTLGFLGRSNQGISLEEILQETGLLHELEWKYTKRFREKWTHKGQVDFIQGQGLR